MTKADKNQRITADEIELIKEAQTGSIPAFNKLYKKYKSIAKSEIMHYITDVDEANYCVNETFLKVYEKLSLFTSYDSFGGWIRTIAKNIAIDQLRQLHSVSSLDVESDRLSPETFSDSCDLDVVDRMTYEQILAEFEKLPESTCTVCKLFYQDNLKIEEISEKLRIPEGTIKSMLFRTRKRLKEKFKDR